MFKVPWRNIQGRYITLHVLQTQKMANICQRRALLSRSSHFGQNSVNLNFKKNLYPTDPSVPWMELNQDNMPHASHLCEIFYKIQPSNKWQKLPKYFNSLTGIHENYISQKGSSDTPLPNWVEWHGLAIRLNGNARGCFAKKSTCLLLKHLKLPNAVYNKLPSIYLWSHSDDLGWVWKALDKRGSYTHEKGSADGCGIRWVQSWCIMPSLDCPVGIMVQVRVPHS